MPTVRKRGDLQWQAIVKRQGIGFASKTFTTKKDAEKWAKITEAEMLRGAYISRRDAEKITLSECIERYKKDVLPGLKGVGHEYILARLEEAFGKLALAHITSAKVAAHRDARLRAGRSPSTVKKELAKLSVIFKLAAQEWGVGGLENPVLSVARPKEKNSRTRRLEPGELERLLKVAPTPVGLLIRLALETAARLGELLALEWRDIDTARRVAVLRGVGGRGTKNGDESRAVPLSSAALAVLQELRALPLGIDGRVFYWWAGSDSFNKPWARLCKKAEIEDLRFHDLRHEATSRLFEKGVFEGVEVAAITGHKTLQMLKRYTHLRAADLARKLG
jgi:integrase